jgi:tetrahydromethanopterin S-methyltransferase subunit B
MYWPEDQNEQFEFTVWNETEDWDITDQVWKVSSDEDGIGPIGDPDPLLTGDDDGSEADDGAATMWWFIGDEDPEDAEDVFSKGTYWLNVTYGDDFEYMTSFVVGDPHARIAPRKSTFRIGDTLSFAIEHSFGNNPLGDIEDGNVDIFDPSGNLYFRTDELDEDHWVKSGMFYYVPISAQVDNENPMILLDDAPLGTWSYEWYEDGGETLIASGTFEVAESTEALITGKIDDLNNQITDLQDTVSDVNSEFDDIRSDIADVAAIAEQAVNAANAVADAVQTVAQTANQANTAAENAAEAANAAKDAANSLTTLVYGAIGAALVAALAAIVSLMQISRRIAG